MTIIGIKVGIGWLAPTFDMNFSNVAEDLFHSIISSWSLGHDVSKYVCYFDQVAMVTIQDLLLAKHCNKRNSKTKCFMLTILG